MEFEWKCIDKKSGDDFMAKNGRYVLRCEEMDKNNWWWAVYFMDDEIDGSNRRDDFLRSEDDAKIACEKSVKKHWVSKIAGLKIAKINDELDRAGFTFDQINAFWNECIAIAKSRRRNG